ncbi:MAG: hypothetical protein FWG43_06035 [Clostridiales bacterium]|nr:hypothetical protein [Clostridiales bacterium]
MRKSHLGWALWGILFILALFMCYMGISRGEMRTVLVKGANICLECLGLG